MLLILSSAKMILRLSIEEPCIDQDGAGFPLPPCAFVAFILRSLLWSSLLADLSVVGVLSLNPISTPPALYFNRSSDLQLHGAAALGNWQSIMICPQRMGECGLF